jgi:hypothetical protein
VKFSPEQSALLATALLLAHGSGDDSAGAKIAADPKGAVEAGSGTETVEEEGSPPWPGAVFDSWSHRWKNPHTGEEHDVETGETHPPGGRAMPSPASVLAGLQDDLPDSLKEDRPAIKRIGDTLLTAAARVNLFLLRHQDKIDWIADKLGSILDTPDDLKKFGYNPTVSGGTAHGGTDALREHLGVSSHLALTIASKALSKAIAWSKKKATRVSEEDSDITMLLAEMLREVFETVNAGLGLDGVPSVEEIAAALGG